MICKPQSVLRCDDTWKVADFGISKLRNNPVTGFTLQGAHTVPWAPPEQIEGAPAHPSVDIYAGRESNYSNPRQPSHSWRRRPP